jgi:tetratricopeptide (TPR) repeat protein
MIATAQAVLAERLQGAPDFPSNGRQVPAALRSIILKCLATRSDRYESAGQLATDLNRYINHGRLQYASEKWKDRFTLWMRRHPAASVVLIVTAILGSFLTCLDYYLESHRLAQFETIAKIDSRQIQSFPHKSQSIAKSHTELFSRDSFIPFSGLEKKRARLLNQFAANRLAAATAEWKASQSSGNNINKSNTETQWNFVVTSCRLAIQECDQALRCDSTLGDAYFQRAESRFMLAELRHDQLGTTVANRLFDQALIDYKLAMTNGVDEALVLAHQAPCRFILGSPCAALDDLHKSLEINPTLQQAIDIRNMMRAAWNQGVRKRFTSQAISLEEYCQEKRKE